MNDPARHGRRTVLKGAAVSAAAVTAIPADANAEPADATGGGVVGTARPRLEAQGKVTGGVRYAADVKLPGLVHGALVVSTVVRGRIRTMDTAAVLKMPGVVGVVDHTNAPRLNPQAGHFFGPDGQLQMLQTNEIHYSGEPVALVVAETLEQAQAAAKALKVTYDELPHDTEFRVDHPKRRPGNPIFGPDANLGDLDAELAASAVVVDQLYRTPPETCCAMEPHAATAWWEGDRLQAIDANQGAFYIAGVLAALFSLPMEKVRIRADHVGGGFGSKGTLGPQLVLATMATTLLHRPVRVTLNRNQVFLTTSGREVIEQRVRLGADRDGRLRAIGHEAVLAISPLADFVENCAEMAKSSYAATAIRTRLSVVPLDVLPPVSVRGPGNTPGSFALESAVDELAEKLRMDPLDLRLRNEPKAGPVSGVPFANRKAVDCMREGARRFGWAKRDLRPRRRREGDLLVGTGMAAVSFLTLALPSTASITAEKNGTYTVSIGAADIGTGARTALASVAADALRVRPDKISIRIADSDFGNAWAASGSLGQASWSWAVTSAAKLLRDKLSTRPPLPVSVTADTTPEIGAMPHKERQSYSSVFAEVTVDPATGEVRVRRLLGMFAIGRVVNPLTARSQAVGGMIMGLSLALHEESARDPNSGRHINADFAGYHISAHADVPDIEADFVPDYEPDIASGIKGVGEIGTAGTAAAIANAVWHATGRRQRDLPIRLDRALEDLARQ
ncbi:xanthine dehydrogenase family protein molybdopterin-binding subunit [Actinocrispum sp. NPDC049592]|uniref:xanthine dehydrogenase family protein molybdopterin-binding subunit n=1 Tax=Actinocrispum sp. NPDC049592 TaxID=3154835 RepID=UPI00342120A9